MYERSAIVLERYFDTLFGFNKQNNLKANYENYNKIIEEIKEYQKITEEEESIIGKFDEVAEEIQEIQNKQSKLHESNLEVENERNLLFNDLGENPNSLDTKLQRIEKILDKNNETIKELREKYVKALVIFTERQKERNKYARIRRTAEAKHIQDVKNANKMFATIEVKDVQEMKKFIESNKEAKKQEIVDIMIKNGKSEKVGFNKQVMEYAVNIRMDIAIKEAELYVSVYERTKRLLNELETETVKLTRAEKLLRDVSVKLAFLNAEKEYIVGFLDNERMTSMNGKKSHDKMMKEACENFKLDIDQINKLYELVLRETTRKSTKKAYKELYNKNYLKEIEEKEKNFEKEVNNIKLRMGTVINSNYWRIEGIKNIYTVFQEEISDKFNKDLSEYRIDEIEEVILPQVDEEKDKEGKQEDKKHIKDNYNEKHSDEEYNEEEYDEEYEDDEYDEEEYDDEEYDEEYEDDEYGEEEYEDDEYDEEEYDDDEYDEEEYDDEEYNEDDDEEDYDEEEYEDDEEGYYDDEDDDDELVEDKIDKIIRNSRKMATKKYENKGNKGLFNKLFKK